MTVCYPQIITARLCSRNELTFSLTPPTCVRVVPVYNDATYVISQFPPPVHFLIRDNGQVYQLADIQSPPSTPPEYHAILDSTGCILVGVELSAVTATPLTNLQINVLPGVLRHVLQTLGLPLTSVVNTLPPQRCRPQLWQQILNETQNCLNTPPPPPPPPPGLTCSFVQSCLNAGQNINISGGTISAGRLIQGPGNGEYTWVGPNGAPIFSFVTSSFNFNVQDTNTVDLTWAGNTLTANVNVSSASGNALIVNADGLFVPNTSSPCFNSGPNILNLPTNNLLVTFNANTNCVERIIVPQQAILYGHPSNNGAPHAQNLFYDPNNNYLRGILSSSASLLTNSVAMLAANSSVVSGSNNVLASINSSLGDINNVVGTFLTTSTDSIFNSVIASNNSSADSGVRNSIAVLDVSTSDYILNSLAIGESSSFGTSLLSLMSLQSSTLFSEAASVITGAESSMRSAIASTINIWQSNIRSSQYSHIAAIRSNANFINASQANLLVTNANIFQASTAAVIGLRGNTTPDLVFSAYYAASSGDAGTNTPLIQHSFVTSDNSSFDDIFYRFSTIHSEGSQFVNAGGGGGISHSFVSVGYTTINNAIQSLLIARTNQQISAFQSLVASGFANTSPPRNTSPSSFIFSSIIATQSSPLPGSAVNSVYASTDVVQINFMENAAYIGEDLVVNDPGFNNARIIDSLIVGSEHDISSVPNLSNVLLVGTRLIAGRQTVFGVGFNVYTDAAIQNAGGWRAYIADGGGPVGQNYFQGWQNAWRFRPFNGSVDYPSTAAAVAALNATYGGDPRNALATMVVAIVQGQPAIFAWNGTTFVRITV